MLMKGTENLKVSFLKSIKQKTLDYWKYVLFVSEKKNGNFGFH